MRRAVGRSTFGTILRCPAKGQPTFAVCTSLRRLRDYASSVLLDGNNVIKGRGLARTSSVDPDVFPVAELDQGVERGAVWAVLLQQLLYGDNNDGRRGLHDHPRCLRIRQDDVLR